MFMTLASVLPMTEGQFAVNVTLSKSYQNNLQMMFFFFHHT